MSDDKKPTPLPRRTILHQRLRKLILMRETGPKSAAWHRARTQMIWRLHHALETENAEQTTENE